MDFYNKNNFCDCLPLARVVDFPRVVNCAKFSSHVLLIHGIETLYPVTRANILLVNAILYSVTPENCMRLQPEKQQIKNTYNIC